MRKRNHNEELLTNEIELSEGAFEIEELEAVIAPGHNLNHNETALPLASGKIDLNEEAADVNELEDMSEAMAEVVAKSW